MKQDFIVDIYNKSTGNKDSHGSYVPGALQYVKTINCDIQPYSRAILVKRWGYDVEVNRIFYIDYYEPSIQIGTVFKYINKQGNTETYEVKAIPWDDEHMEVTALGI